jgi:hypothetical protein
MMKLNRNIFVVLIKMEMYVFFFVLLMNSACNPIPKKDSHPELPYLKELLKDQSKFKKVKFNVKDETPELYFLKSGKIVLSSNNSDAPIKIVDVNNKVLFEKVYNWNIPFYMDSIGNIYCDNKKYLAPQYKSEIPFTAVNIADSMNAYRSQLEKMFPSTDNALKQWNNDSVSTKMYTEFEKQLLLKYGIDTNSSDDMIYKISNNQLIVFNNKGNLFVIDAYLKSSSKVEYFDESILLEYRTSGGHFGGPYPVYLNYHLLKNGIKFKEEDNPWPVTISLDGNDYIYFNKCGLYQINK